MRSVKSTRNQERNKQEAVTKYGIYKTRNRCSQSAENYEEEIGGQN